MKEGILAILSPKGGKGGKEKSDDMAGASMTDAAQALVDALGVKGADVSAVAAALRDAHAACMSESDEGDEYESDNEPPASERE